MKIHDALIALESANHHPKDTLTVIFDDIKRTQECDEFQEAILEDLKALQLDYDRIIHISDFFAFIVHCCEQLLSQGKAYVDDADPISMKQERDQKLESRNRSNGKYIYFYLINFLIIFYFLGVEKNLQLWEEMKNGTKKGQHCCVRAIIAMKHSTPYMRDPVIFYSNPKPHIRTGSEYK